MKKLIITLVFAVALFGCGKETVDIIQAGPPGADGQSCTIEGTVLVCPDGTFLDIQQIIEEYFGTSCTVVRFDGGATITCPDGTSVTVYDGADGLDGHDGLDGEQGPPGEPGQDGQDGHDGHDGQDGQDGAD